MNQIPLAPGRHHVHVHVPYFFSANCGPADTVVDVAPGQLVSLQYKAPVWSFSAGSLGPGEQKYNGVGIVVAVMAVPFVMLFLLLLIIAAA